MKLSILTLYPVAIALPLVVLSLIAVIPAGAEQLSHSRSRVDNSISSVTDLNLSIPTDRQQANSEPEIQTNPTQKTQTITNRDAKIAPRNIEQPSKVKSARRRRSIVVTHINASTSTLAREYSRSKSIPSQRPVDTTARFNPIDRFDRKLLTQRSFKQLESMNTDLSTEVKSIDLLELTKNSALIRIIRVSKRNSPVKSSELTQETIFKMIKQKGRWKIDSD